MPRAISSRNYPAGFSLLFEKKGETRDFELLGGFGNGDVVDVTESSRVTLESSDTAVATVDKSGTITAVGAGLAAVVACTVRETEASRPLSPSRCGDVEPCRPTATSTRPLKHAASTPHRVRYNLRLDCPRPLRAIRGPCRRRRAPTTPTSADPNSRSVDGSGTGATAFANAPPMI